jgi:beta-lactamase class A
MQSGSLDGAAIAACVVSCSWLRFCPTCPYGAIVARFRFHFLQRRPTGPASRYLAAVPGLLLAVGVLALTGCAASRPAPCHQSPWLDKYSCETPVISKVPYASLKQKLTEYFDRKKQAGVLTDAGMYFRDLEDGPHFGVNEYANFAAASLLKLPLVMQYLSLAEDDPALLKVRIRVPDQIGILYNVSYPPPEKLVPGSDHTVEDLLQRTMEHSDNVAFVMLRQYLAQRYGGETFLREAERQLGLVPEVAAHDYVISVVRYAAMFKLLYRASFLNSAKSEEIIEMMLHTSFDRGLEQGVPPGVPVAHKFGEKGVNYQYDDRVEFVAQLHDCGIVYYPDNPYILCVMTRGHSNAELEQVLGEVSRMVYEEVDSRRGRQP